MSLEPDWAVAKNPFSAVAIFGDALLCVADGRYQPLWGEFAHVVRDAVEDVVSIQTLARRHDLTGEELEMFSKLFVHLVQLGVLSVEGTTAPTSCNLRAEDA